MTKAKKIKSYKWGHYGELLACGLLLLKGYSIKERRYRTRMGEIDIIAKRGKTTIFCEVKARKSFVTAVESLSDKQKARISKSAELYLAHLKIPVSDNKLKNENYRCDMIVIVPWQWPVHIKNAW